MTVRRHQFVPRITHERRKSREQAQQEKRDEATRIEKLRAANQRANQRAYCREDLIRIKLLKPKSS